MSTPTTTVSVGGEFLHLSPVPEQRRHPERKDAFQIEPGAPARARFGFISQYSDATPFRILLLLNYRQVNFAARLANPSLASGAFPVASPIALLAAGEMRLALEFTAPPGEEIDFDLWTEPLAEGFYDLALIVVPDPDQTQRDLPYFTVRQHVIRASVRVGEAA
ncbi:MAG: hypothetical protein IT337_15985, partial [Thermomicrobiales bacterium]|nr:hypothetical protein [Thermomicrobiales bacterium]